MADKLIDYKKGDIISKQGSYELWMYEILSGTVGIYQNYGESDEKKIAEVNDNYVGEMGLISSMPRNATIVAMDDVLVAQIEEQTFVEYFREHPDKIYSLICCLADRLASIDTEVQSVSNTIKDMIAVEEKNEEKNGALVNAMKKFSSIFKSRSV
ncbi:MAG: cyclic nucleotide-binding domain-containing protein [Lachnospiraceae bacterium]|nr:cyclic nucleotide-binding domain-containing protein [Lachnospiraceae bacterium]